MFTKPSDRSILRRLTFLCASLIAASHLGFACSSQDPSEDGEQGGAGGVSACEPAPEIENRPFDIALGAIGGTSSADNVGGGGGQGGAIDLQDSGCVVLDDFGREKIVCEGLARVSIETEGPVLELADGSTFEWRLDTFDAGKLATESVVRLDYVLYEQLICTFCGSTPRRTLIVSDANAPEQVLLYWNYSARGDGLYSVATMLGLDLEAVEEVEICSIPSEADCHLDVITKYYDLRIASSPTQHLPAGEISEVTTSRGTFDFYSRTFAQVGEHQRNCEDGRGLQEGGPILVIRQ